MAAGEARGEAALLLGLELGLAGPAAQALGGEGGKRRIILRQGRSQRVIGCHRHERGAEQRVGTGGEDLDRVLAAFQGEADAGTGGLADPVALHQPDLVRPAFQPVQGADQRLGEGGDAEEPLRQLAPLDHGTAAPAAAVDHLLVGEHGLVDRIPIDPALLAVDQPALEHVEEHRLLVAVIGRIAGGDLARPVERAADRLHLLAHLGDVGVGPGRRMHALLDRRVLGRQPERVPAHRMEDVEALGPLQPGDDVAHRVVADMAHVDAPRGIGEHLEHVVFRPRPVDRRLEAAALLPDLLPLGLGGAERVT